MTADDTRAAILAQHTTEPDIHEARRDLTETRDERRRRMSRDRARLSRERKAERERAAAAEHRGNLHDPDTPVRQEPYAMPVERERSAHSGDGRILGAVHGIGGPNPTIMNFRREPAVPTFEQWLEIPRAVPELPIAVIAPGISLSFFESDGLSERARVAFLISEATGHSENAVRERISRASAGERIQF